MGATVDGVTEVGAFDHCYSVFRPPPEEPALLWVMRKMHTPDGRPWDHFATPHIGAPGGPLEAFQDPTVREIYLQFGTRLGKTWFGLIAMLWASYAWPAPCMFVSASRDLVERNIGNKAWPMAAATGEFGRLPPEGRRAKRKMRLPRCRWESGWAESAQSLADYSAKYLHLSEISKWRYLAGTKEADPFELAKERGKEWADRKIIGESTPTVKRKCRIEANCQKGWSCRYFVPCPKCLRWQKLNKGSGKKGGIVYDHGPGGRNDAATAYRTGRYVCAHCEAELRNDVRDWMMRRGVWVPQGCDVDHDGAAALFEGLENGESHHRELHAAEDQTYRWDGWSKASWIRGTPVKDGEIASYQLSAIYALFHGWGKVAQEWVESRKSTTKLRNFINSWLAETWEEVAQTEEWETLAKLLTRDVPEKVVPLAASLVTCGIDRQEDHFVYVAIAWAPGKRPAVIDYGNLETRDEVRALLLSKYEHQDGGPAVPIRLAMVDVNFHPVEEDGSIIHTWIRETTGEARRLGLPLVVKACRGANHQLDTPTKTAPMGKRSNCPGAELTEVCPEHTQSWINMKLFGKPLDEPEAEDGETGSRGEGQKDDEERLWLFQAERHEHEDFLKQLLNEAPFDLLDKRGRARRTWKRIDESFPNDYRDGGRYAFAGMLLATRNGPVASRGQVVAAESTAARPRETKQGLTTPDGRPWFVLNRRT